MGKARQDDPSISGDVRLWRRIPDRPQSYKYDEKLKDLRPSSMNFRDPELSVDIAGETTIAKILEGHAGFGVVEFTAALAREVFGGAVIICRDPKPDNPAHTLICGKKSRSGTEKLAKKCSWVKKPGSPSRSWRRPMAVLISLLVLAAAVAAYFLLQN